MGVDDVLLGRPLVLAFDYRALEAKGAIIAILENLGYKDIFYEFGIKEKLAVNIKNLTKDAGNKDQSKYEKFSKYVLGPKGEPPDHNRILEKIIEFSGSDVKANQLIKGKDVLYDMGTYLPEVEDKMDAIDAARLAVKFADGFPVILSCMNGQVMNAAAAALKYMPTFGYSIKAVELGRWHNDAMALIIPADIEFMPGEPEIGGELTEDIINTFLKTPYNPENNPIRDRRREKWKALKF